MSWTRLAVLDFEATCEDRAIDSSWNTDLQEIIELPVALIDVAERRVIDSFGTFVRPVHQPKLTAFCTRLTTIRDEDLDGQPTIVEAMEQFTAWLDEHGVTGNNTLTITCGDWDLLRMWPKQVTLVPELETPDIFRQWCNLKHPVEAFVGRRAGGMMAMLRALKLPHQGIHHRGADDVANIARIVLALLEAGQSIDATWAEPQRRAEQARHLEALDAAKKELEMRRHAVARLPAYVEQPRIALDGAIRRLEAEVRRHSVLASVFGRPL